MRNDAMPSATPTRSTGSLLLAPTALTISTREPAKAAAEPAAATTAGVYRNRDKLPSSDVPLERHEGEPTVIGLGVQEPVVAGHR